MTRCLEEYEKAAKRRKKAGRPLAPGSDQYRAKQVRAEYFAKPLVVRKAIAKAQAAQGRLM